MLVESIAIMALGIGGATLQSSFRADELKFTAARSRSQELAATLSSVYSRLTPRVAKSSQIQTQRLSDIQEFTARLAVSPSLDHVAGQTASELAVRLKSSLSEESRKRGWNSEERERALASLALDWCRLRIKYNSALAKLTASGDYALGRQVVSRFWQAEGVLSLREPSAVCSGITRVALVLLGELGFQAHLVNVGVRPVFESGPYRPESNHSIILIEFSDGTLDSADLVKAGMSVEAARARGTDLRNSFCLPILPEEKALFWYMNFAMDYDGRIAIPARLAVTSMPITEWASLASGPGRSVMKEFVKVSETARTFRDRFDP